MCNVKRVKMLNCTDHLGKNLCSGYFRQGTVLVEIVEEFETLGQLHEDVDMRISPNSLINSDYVRVVELFMDKNLSPQMLQVLDGKPLKTNHFDSNFSFRVYFNSLVDVCETPFSNHVA